MKQQKKIKVRYLDIDGVLATYIAGLSASEKKNREKEIQEVFNEFKLTFPTKEIVEEEWKNNNVNIYFKLSKPFSRDMVDYIVGMNTNLYMNVMVSQWNKEEKVFDWNYTVKKVGTWYEYHLYLLNKQAYTYKYHQATYDSKKVLPKYVHTNVLSKEAVQAFNKLMEEKPCETLSIVSAWRIDKSIPFIMDLLSYQGVSFPEDLKLEKLNYIDYDRGLSIADDILKKQAQNSYDVIDDDFFETYVMFKDHLISPNNGLSMEDVETYLKQDEEKVKVMKLGN